MEPLQASVGEILEGIIHRGHVTIRRPHHMQSLCTDLMVNYAINGYFNTWRDKNGLLMYQPLVPLEFLSGKVEANLFNRVSKYADYPYIDKYADSIPSYRFDMFGNEPCDRFVHCHAAYDLYALLRGGQSTCRIIAQPDEICDFTKHGLHCRERVMKNNYGRSVPIQDEEEMLWVVNLLKLRSFINEGAVERQRIPGLVEKIDEGEKWLSRIGVYSEGRNIDPLEEYNNLSFKSLQFETSLGVALDPYFWEYLHLHGIGGMKIEYPVFDSDLAELGYCESRGFTYANIIDGLTWG